MHRKKPIYSLLKALAFATAILFFGKSPVHGQAFSLRTFSVDAGLAQSQVYASLADSRGLLWFGTRGGGLSVFDGIEFRTVSEQDGLISNYIRAIYEDDKGELWIGTDEGVSNYNGIAFQHFTAQNGLKSSGVNTIMQDAEGNYWFGTDGGIDILDRKTGEFSHIGKAEGLVNVNVVALLRDATGNIWVGTFGGLNVLPAGKPFLRSNLHRYDRYHGLPESHIRGLSEDSKGNIWICTYGGGVAKFKSKSAKIGDSRPFQYIGTQQGLTDGIVFSAQEDREGNIWFSTLSGGAQRYDGKYFTYFTQDEGLYSNHVRCIIEDDWGNIWIGTSGGGVSRFAGDQFVHFSEKNGLPGNRVYSVVQDAQGNMWFGTSGGGVTRYDGETFTQFGRQQGFKDVITKAAFRSSDGQLWFGTEGAGASRYDGKRFYNYGRNDGLSGNWVKQILEDGKGRIWMATAGGGLSMYENGRFTAFHVASGLPSERVNCLSIDGKGDLWVGTADRGIARFNGSKFVPYSEGAGLCSNIIRSAARDADGNIWWGTANGISYMQVGGEMPQFRCITKSDGLTSENIYLTIHDNSGNLWAGTERGVDKLILNENGKIREIRQFGASEGFTGIETCQRASFRDKQGNIWFGTINGVTRHNPRDNERNKLAPETHITAVSLFYERISQTEYADSVSEWYGLPVGLDLPHHQNHLGFEFVGINHKNPRKVKYQWRLKGYEEEYTPLSTRREVNYSNLNAGTYTFQLKAFNEDGVTTRKPVEFSFEIHPPWWATWWFRIAGSAFVILGVFAIFQLRIRQIRKENDARNRKVTMEKQMLELEQKALRLQMNPHFIFNALNSIKGCMAANDVPAARKYLVKFAQLMRLILDNSREAWISVATELKTLQLYLDLEKLSKADKFEYNFTVDDEINPENVKIPPMIIQPFVENAVIHGVAPLKDGGLIAVDFRREGTQLVCTIRDNGVGREKGLERRKNQDSFHKSKGISVTEERLSLLDPDNLSDFKIVFRDLKDSEGEPLGTEVEIVLPFEEM